MKYLLLLTLMMPVAVSNGTSAPCETDSECEALYE